MIICPLDKNGFKRNNGYKGENSVRQSWISSLLCARFIVAPFLIVFLLWKFAMISPFTNHIIVVETLVWWKSQIQKHQLAYEEWEKCIFMLKIDLGNLNVLWKILGNGIHISVQTNRLPCVSLWLLKERTSDQLRIHLCAIIPQGVVSKSTDIIL